MSATMLRVDRSDKQQVLTCIGLPTNSFNEGKDALVGEVDIPAGTGNGSSSPQQVKANILGIPPQGTMYLLAVTDPDNDLGDFNASTHVLALDCSPSTILKNSVKATIVKTQVTASITVSTMTATMTPAGGALNLQQAYAICGVNHFNWIQLVTEPSDWSDSKDESFDSNGNPIPDPKTLLPLTQVDPTPYAYYEFSPYPKTAGVPWPSVTSIAAFFGHNGFYWGEDPGDPYIWSNEISADGFTLEFRDTPSTADGLFGPNEYLSFVTMLFGVDGSGNSIPLNASGISFNWTDNATKSGGGGALLVTTFNPFTPVVVSGPSATVTHQTLGIGKGKGGPVRRSQRHARRRIWAARLDCRQSDNSLHDRLREHAHGRCAGSAGRHHRISSPPTSTGAPSNSSKSTSTTPRSRCRPACRITLRRST